MKKKIKQTESNNQEVKYLDIIDFINSMKGKRRATAEDVKTMYALYNKYTGQTESNFNCDTCVIRVFTTLKNFIKK
jgi:hypothetical protein